jgi:N6-adenosine-specific RNA methylase IME4
MSTPDLAHVVVADPPWSFADSLPGKGRGAIKHYPTMSARDIESIRLPYVHTDALLFLWRVASMQEEALRVCRAWGFRPVSEMVWAKVNEQGTARMGMGRYLRNAHESCIVATRGRGIDLIRSRSMPSWFVAKRSRHSAKPAVFYAMIERLAEGPYLELFAREEREGWRTLGNELGSAFGLPLEGPSKVLTITESFAR